MKKLRPNLSVISIHVNYINSLVINWFSGWMKNQTKCSLYKGHILKKAIQKGYKSRQGNRR